MPTYGELFSYGFKKTKENFFFLFGLLVIFALLSVLNSTVQAALVGIGVLVFFVGLAFSLVQVLFELGFLKIMLKLIAGTKPTYRDLYLHYPQFIDFLLAGLIMGLLIAGGFILLILPGIYLAIRLQFTPLFVADKGLKPVDAVKGSWELTKGKWMKVFVFDLLTVGINILGLLALVVGLLVTIPMTSLAYVYFYKKLQG
ncbi:MAG: hypothetical protein A2186_03380 [Candidatus Levybacteria bacterium RIFOXYA1_FULL_41_10]|nr:MAG: hypothetical protein UT44_C0017G0018 [Candidatus Levybacteria bacterium GW2011_GWA1_39_32]KKR49741.1 MAG: hypothetical protein UT87_C0026G0003 [Candidatus Levybacteria bacterium GW2011_GWC1_40_19]KKR72849.1 MAG: hypothetical protein UU15_C0025G0018 [Candidatus Levybacteria bacterium GW2011_GWC2_40_7]KKR95132.1 MAG: hypothetical protein UU45_C0004G0035 [Candidatus Levybacteria bacterium GW2011_GWA2_41_15]OGH27720.1 MAG: hypothetical protein A3D82_04665 [Candidatus Levybacteria bacterium 